jgi:DNA-binding phage protein
MPARKTLLPPYDPGLLDPKYAKEFMDSALATNDPKIAIIALGRIVRARAPVTGPLKGTAANAGLSYEGMRLLFLSTYRGVPLLSTFMNLMKAAGLKLSVEIDEKAWEE